MRNILFVSFKHVFIVFLIPSVLLVLLSFSFFEGMFGSVGQEASELISLLVLIVSYFLVLKWSAGQLHKQGYAHEARRIAIQSSIIAVCAFIGIHSFVMQTPFSEYIIRLAISGLVFFFATERYVSGKGSGAKSFQLSR